MLGCSLEEAFGGIKRKKNIRNNHANIISRSKLNIDDTPNNRLDEKIIISENVEESKKEIENKTDEIKNDVLNKLNTVLNRLETLENKFNKSDKPDINLQELSGLEANRSSVIKSTPSSQPIKKSPNSPPVSRNINNTSNLISKLNNLRNRNNNNNTNNNNNNTNNNTNNTTTNNSNNTTTNNSNNTTTNNNNNNNNNSNMLVEGFTNMNNNNISYVGDQLNELLLFGLMGIFILLLFDYIYKLGKKSF